MRSIALVAAAVALSLGTTAAFAAPVADARAALTRINDAGYVAPYELEFRHGVWTAEATTAEGLRVDLLVDADTGAVSAVDERGTAGTLTATQLRDALAAAGYTRIHDVDFDDGFWEAEATAPNGDRVDLVLHPVTAAVLSSRIDYDNDDDDNDDVPPTGSNALTADAIRALLTTAGYTRITDVEFDDGRWEAEATNPQGVRVDLVLDPVTGAILRERRDD